MPFGAEKGAGPCCHGMLRGCYAPEAFLPVQHDKSVRAKKTTSFLFILHIDNFFIIPYAESSSSQRNGGEKNGGKYGFVV